MILLIKKVPFTDENNGGAYKLIYAAMEYSISFYVIFVKKDLKINLFFVNMHIYKERKLFFEKSFFIDFPFCGRYNKNNEVDGGKDAGAVQKG
jgi:hypothetical protein